MTNTIGLLGFGRIGSYILEQTLMNPQIEVACVFEPDKSKTLALDSSLVLSKEDEMLESDVDLVVEAADFRVVQHLAPQVLENTNMMILSVTALSDKKLHERIQNICTEFKTRYFIPHGAILGMDGLFDARSTLEEVQIITIKNPRNIDFSFTDKWDPSDIKEKTTLYDGPTRGICSMFPRNVNAHAVVAMSCLGFDDTRSILITDPNSNDALQHITARGGGALLEIKRSSVIKGVTGDFTLASIYGSVIRSLGSPSGLSLV